MEINTKTWKKFKVGDLFDCYLGKSPCKQNINETGKYPVISAQTNNNGIIGYTDYEDGNFIYNDKLTLGNRGSYRCFYQGGKFYAGNNVIVFDEKVLMNKFHKLFIAVLINKLDFCGYTKYPTKTNITEKMILLPSKNNEPDWDFMEKYIKEIKDKYIDKIEKLNDENIKKALEVAGLTEEDIDKELIVPVCNRYEEFKVGELFDKRTIKGVPKYKEDLAEDKDGYHIFGQNIKYQYPQKILLDESYLQKIKRPIIAYSSSTAQINYINESFYRTGDNGAFQGLFPKFKNSEMPTLLYILTVLQKRFKYFGYATEMTNIVDLRLLLPAIDKSTPNFDFMEKYIYIYISIFIKNKKLDNERKVELMRKAL